MHIFLVLIAALLLLAIVFLFCLAPNKRKNISFPFNSHYIAHRGLFNNDTSCPENSIPAFKNAAKCGYGIELDVQLTRDRKLVVFHDETLSRMCGVEKKVRDCSFKELQKLSLAKSDQTIPLFADVLKTVKGTVPLIVEIKPEGDYKAATYSTLSHLKNYKGDYCVESFNPFVVKIVKKERPDIIRGQLSSSTLIMNVISRPDFVAFYHKKSHRLDFKIFKKLFGGTTVAWTVRNQQELTDAEKVYDCIIFDSFIPNKKTTP